MNGNHSSQHEAPFGNDCESMREDFPAYTRGELGESDEARIRLHLGECAACALALQSQQSILETLATSQDEYVAPASLTDKVFAHILLDNAADVPASNPALTDRTLQAVLRLPMPAKLREMIPLHWQLLRSTLAACILGTIAMYALFTPYLGYAEAKRDGHSCAENLEYMGKLIQSYPLLTGADNPLQHLEGVLTHMYFNEYDGVASGVIKLQDLCSCPGSNLAVSYSSQILSFDQVNSPMPGSVPIVWDRRENHKNGRNVLFLDGTVDFLTEEDFLILLRRYKRGLLASAN